MKSESGKDLDPQRAAELSDIASAFVRARLEARSLSAYPGEAPEDLESAYRCQDIAIDLWPDRLSGWKVGRIPSGLEERFGSDRLAGPIFEHGIHIASDAESPEMPVFVGGFAAVEAEFVAVVAVDAPEDKIDWTREEAAEMIRELRLGMEIASSPLSTINELGPAVVVSDFGNNAGLLVGGPIQRWRTRDLSSMVSETFVDSESVGRGGAFRLSGGPTRSVQFMLKLAAERGRPLRAGQVIATGQTTGIHPILPGASARVLFESDGEASCRAVAATAR